MFIRVMRKPPLFALVPDNILELVVNDFLYNFAINLVGPPLALLLALLLLDPFLIIKILIQRHDPENPVRILRVKQIGFPLGAPQKMPEPIGVLDFDFLLVFFFLVIVAHRVVNFEAFAFACLAVVDTRPRVAAVFGQGAQEPHFFHEDYAEVAAALGVFLREGAVGFVEWLVFFVEVVKPGD